MRIILLIVMENLCLSSVISEETVHWYVRIQNARDSLLMTVRNLMI